MEFTDTTFNTVNVVEFEEKPNHTELWDLMMNTSIPAEDIKPYVDHWQTAQQAS